MFLSRKQIKSILLGVLMTANLPLFATFSIANSSSLTVEKSSEASSAKIIRPAGQAFSQVSDPNQQADEKENQLHLPPEKNSQMSYFEKLEQKYSAKKEKLL